MTSREINAFRDASKGVSRGAYCDRSGWKGITNLRSLGGGRHRGRTQTRDTDVAAIPDRSTHEPGCAALFPRAAGTRFAEEPPIPPACLDAIDEIVVKLPGWTTAISIDPRLDLSNSSWGALETGSTVVVSIVGRYGTRDVLVRVPEPRPELTGEVESGGDDLFLSSFGAQ